MIQAEDILNMRSQQYISAYLAAIGANIHVGEKRARKLARQAGCCAIRHVQEDMALDYESIDAACQETFEAIQEQILKHKEAEAAKILVPDHHTKGNNGIITP